VKTNCMPMSRMPCDPHIASLSQMTSPWTRNVRRLSGVCKSVCASVCMCVAVAVVVLVMQGKAAAVMERLLGASIC
jgi:hypothetical protein